MPTVTMAAVALLGVETQSTWPWVSIRVEFEVKDGPGTF